MMSNGIEEISTISRIENLSTGVDGLDFQLNGGIPAGSLILLICDPLSGMDKLSVQFWKADDSGISSYFMLDSPVSEGMTDATDLHPDEIFRDMAGRWVVVDSLSTILLKYGIDEVLKFLLASSEKIKEERGNLLLIMYKDIHSPYDEILIKRMCNTVFTLNTNLHGSEIERNLEVNKIEGQDLPKRVYPYNILAKGFELSTTGRVV